MSDHKSSALARRVRAFVSLPAMLLVFVLGCILVVNVGITRQKLMREVVDLRAAKIHAALASYLAAIEGAIESVAEYQGVSELSAPVLAQLLATIIDRDRAIARLEVLDKKGMILAALGRRDGPSMPMGVLSNDAFVVPTTLHTGYTSAVAQSGEQLLLRRALPLRDRERNIVGVVIASLDLRYLVRVLAQSNHSDGGYAYIEDRYGHLVGVSAVPTAMPTRSGRGRASSLPLGWMWRLLGPPEIHQGLGGSTVISKSLLLPAWDMKIAVEMPIQALFGPFLLKTAWAVSVVCTSALLIGLLLSHLVERQFLTPLLSLAQQVESYQVGAPPLALGTERADEIGLLERSFRDLTARLHEAFSVIAASNAELTASRKDAEAAMRAKADFLAVMSHEIRTPLNGVIGLSGLLMDKPLGEQEKELVSIINRNSNHLLTLINDVLDFSRMEAGRMPQELRPFALRTVVEEALEMVLVQAEAKHLDLFYRIAEDVPGRVLGNPAHLRQILLNLLGNAIKFTQVGSISLSIDRLQAQANHSVELRFCVEDTGVGIAPDMQARLFQPFSQAATAHTPTQGGTGLGLAICKRLVDLGQGRIWAENRASGGASFGFTLHYKALAVESMPSPKPAPGPRPRLGIVTTEALRAQHLQGLAEELGWSAVAVASQAQLEKDNDISAAVLDFCGHAPTAAARGQTDAANLQERCAALRQAVGRPDLPLIVITPLELTNATLNALAPMPLKLSRIARRDAFFHALRTLTKVPDLRPPPAARAASPVPPRLRILVAEDNPVNQLVAAMSLKQMGHDADCVSNGLEALDALEQRRYDVVLMDVQMPHLDGIEATRRLREKLPRDQQPLVVALTAMALDGDSEKCLAAGMDAYLAKPINFKDLEEILYQRLGHPKMQS